MIPLTVFDYIIYSDISQSFKYSFKQFVIIVGQSVNWYENLIHPGPKALIENSPLLCVGFE